MKNRLHLVVPTLLVTVFCIQFYLVHNHNLTQWKGGGFGMFSTIDAPSERSLKIQLNTDHGPVSVNKYSIRELSVRDITKIEAIPSINKLEDIFQIIKSKTWSCNSFADNGEKQRCRTAKIYDPEEESIPLQIESVTIGVERLTYDGRANKAGTEIILIHTLDW